LRYLRVLDYSIITGIGLEEGVKSLPNLEKLELTSCYLLSNIGLIEIS